MAGTRLGTSSVFSVGPPGSVASTTSWLGLAVGSGGALSVVRRFCSATIAKITGTVAIVRAKAITRMEIAIRVISVPFSFLSWNN